MAFLQIDTCYAAVIDLTEEFAEVGTTLMPHPSIWEQTGHITSLHNAIAEVNVLTKAHLRKASQLKIDITTDTHIERTGIELIELSLAATDAASGKEGRHGIADGLLDRCK